MIAARLASLLDVRVAGRQAAVVCAPCARDGAVLAAMIEAWEAKDWLHATDRVVAVELDRARGAALAKRFNHVRHQVIIGDAFAATWNGSRGASVLFLHPPAAPYRQEGRPATAAHQFLIRYTGALAPGGGLLYLIPEEGLDAAAEWLASWYEDIRVYELPENGWERDCSVLAIIARKRAERDPQARLRSELRALARYPTRVPPLPDVEPEPLLIPAGEYGLFLIPSSLDRTALLEAFRPWAGVPCGMDRSLADLSRTRTFPTALPPKPAHLALALASGQFDGQRLEPDDPGAGLPPILVKAVFHREEVHATDKLGPGGELKARVMVERPSFRMAILRLDTFDFVEPAHGAHQTGARDLAGATVRDILELYGQGFARLMDRQFPPLHDPATSEHQLRLPDLERRPLRCQVPAISAALKLVANGGSVIFGSSVGTGKSTMALYVWQALTARHREETIAGLKDAGFARPSLPPPVRRLLIVCPPHLVEEWEEQILGSVTLAPIAAEARIQVVKSVADLHRPADVYLMSHGAAKLGSRRRGVDRCPRCGSATAGAEETAAKGIRCRSSVRLPANGFARLAEDLAAALLHVLPDSPFVRLRLARHRVLRELLERIAPSDGSEPKRARGKGDRERLVEIIGAYKIVQACAERSILYRPTLLGELHALLANAAPEATKALQVVKLLARAIGEDGLVAEALDALAAGRRTPGKYTVWESAVEAAKDLRHAETLSNARRREYLRSAVAGVEELAAWTTRPAWKLSRHRQGLRPAALPGETAEELEKERPERCGEFLWQYTAEPRRYPLARYITRKLPRGHFGVKIFDEIQELNNLRSAQGQAARRLMAHGGVSLGLSGSIMGGYASSLFPNFVSLLPAFRERFGWDGAGRFLDAYGFRKWIYTAAKPRKRPKKGDGEALGQEWTRRDGGEATGVMPLFLLRYLLPHGVIVHQADLDQEIPPAVERQIPLRPETDTDHEVLAEYYRLEEALLDQIEADMFVPGLAGKLLGALLELPSYLDRCIEDLGPFVLRYPPDVEGGAIVAEGRLFPASYRTVKERRMVALVLAERQRDRRVALFVRHVSCGLPERLLRLLREEGMKRAELVYLSASAVPAARRKSWIREKVVAAGASVMACNPNTVRTGLNDLVYLSTAWWHEVDPGGALTFRQANGRLHRPGQTRETEFLVPHYADTAQEIGVDLVARKIEASEQVDALSVRGALRASGAEDGEEDEEGVGMSIGQIIYERLKQMRSRG